MRIRFIAAGCLARWLGLLFPIIPYVCNMRFGTSYYPELVDESEWGRDLDLMRASGLDHLRILDFAWTAIEPREGVYAWDWLDRFIAMAHARGLQLIMCTPTATPPAWLARQYPEIMLAGRDLQPRAWGNRREADVESPIYRDFSAGIAAAMGQRYGRHPAVIGWQLDNELVGSELLHPENHSRAGQWRFRAFLKRRHGEVATLNQRWGMRFWNQEFSDWGEVDTPHHSRPSLGHWLDYGRHFSESQRDYLACQAAALRPHLAPGQWISHNSTAVFDRGIDHRVYAEALDLVGWDAYAGAAAGRPGIEKAAFTALAHDLFRSTMRKPFWVFETGPMSDDHNPAVMAEMAVRGAAGICFWHWRGHRAHVEMGCSTFCDVAGRPIPERLAALRDLVDEPLLQALPAPVVQAKVALLFSPDCVRHDMQPNPYRQRPDWYLKAVAAWAAALRGIGLAVDVVRPGDGLDGYRLIVVPSPLVLDHAEAEVVATAVRRGAVFAGSARSAHLDAWGGYRADLGSPLAEVLGTTWSRDESAPAGSVVDWQGEYLSVEPWAERVTAIDGEVLARISGGSWDGSVAAYRRSCGAGTVFYLPCWSGRLCAQIAPLAARAAGLAVEPAIAGVGRAPDPLGRGMWSFNDGTADQHIAGAELAPGAYRLSAAMSAKA